MILSLYFDHHVHSAITRGLRQRGIQVLTADEDRRNQAADDDLLARATELGRIFFSYDQDLLVHATNWQRTGRDFAGLIYAKPMALTIGQCIDELELVCRAQTLEEMANTIIWLPI